MKDILFNFLPLIFVEFYFSMNWGL